MNTAGSVASPRSASRTRLTLPRSTSRADSWCARRKMSTRPTTSSASSSESVKTNGGDRRPSPARIGIPNRAHDQDQQNLCRETGADEDFDQRAHALEREHPPAFRNIRRLRDRLEHRKGTVAG